MGLSVFTPALLIISGICTLAFVLGVLNFASLISVKARMVTQNQQEVFGAALLAKIQESLVKAAEVNKEAIESLRADYRTHVTEVAEVKAAHQATLRQVDQVMQSYSSLNQLLIKRLLDMATGHRATSPDLEIAA